MGDKDPISQGSDEFVALGRPISGDAAYAIVEKRKGAAGGLRSAGLSNLRARASGQVPAPVQWSGMSADLALCVA